MKTIIITLLIAFTLFDMLIGNYVYPLNEGIEYDIKEQGYKVYKWNRAFTIIPFKAYYSVDPYYEGPLATILSEDVDNYSSEAAVYKIENPKSKLTYEQYIQDWVISRKRARVYNSYEEAQSVLTKYRRKLNRKLYTVDVEQTIRLNSKDISDKIYDPFGIYEMVKRFICSYLKFC